MRCWRCSTYGDVLEGLLEGEGHATADDERVDLVEHVLDQLNLVRDLRTAEDGEEGALGVLKSLGEVLELLLDEEARGALRQLDTDHRRVRTVRSAKGVVHIHIAELREALTEGGDRGGVGLGLRAVLVLDGSLLLDVEAEVLEEDDGASGGVGDSRLDLRTDTVRGEDDGFRELLLELGRNGLERVLLDHLAIGAAEVGHEDNLGGA